MDSYQCIIQTCVVAATLKKLSVAARAAFKMEQGRSSTV